MPLRTHSDRLWCGNVGCHNFMFVGTPETHGTIPPNQEQIFVYYYFPWECTMTSEFYTPFSVFEFKPCWTSVDCRISHGLWLLRVSLPVCRQRLSGQAGRGRGIGSPVLSLPYSLFCFLLWWREGGSQTDAFCLAIHNAWHDTQSAQLRLSFTAHQ